MQSYSLERTIKRRRIIASRVVLYDFLVSAGGLHFSHAMYRDLLLWLVSLGIFIL